MLINKKIKVELDSGGCVFLNMQGEYFFGESQRRLSGKWQLYVVDNKIFLEDEIEIIIASSDLVYLMPLKRENNKCYVGLSEERKDENTPYEPINAKSFVGSILVQKQDEQLLAINEIDIEPFVERVLNNYCPKSMQLEFLKVQAMVIRNAALLLATDKLDADCPTDILTDSDGSSMLGNTADNLMGLYLKVPEAYRVLVQKAVEETRGMALVCNNKIKYVLCNNGALALAQQGKTTEQIVADCLPGFEIQKQYQ